MIEFVDNSEHFSRRELQCKFTGECKMSKAFLIKLETLRSHYGKPIHLTSAYRSPEHPVEKAKSKDGKPRSTGYHALGKAVDIACWNADGARLLEIGIKMGLFGGYGFCFTGSSRFLHVDDRDRANGLMIWSY
tara:strand:- start:96 stop:494 length:399 start_codon:yes stop_codon:yes gene_type:complete